MKNGSEQEIKLVKEDVIPFDMKGKWEAMVECHKLGLAKSIGVCNFSCTKLSQLLAHATIPPVVNQFQALRSVHCGNFFYFLNFSGVIVLDTLKVCFKLFDFCIVLHIGVKRGSLGLIARLM
ncbi:hypothetical protein HAX54_018092 [Datura stramonium]|uniref:NADP-dependent oxidoreductase domain-containing protein n=1 Tax=Datura stramonium TaxID=4076 RepID=A0ABS8UN94_DATST|nr:hypothetical protein [Datura stramonium]